MSGWADFLTGYHAANPALTEDLLLPMRGPGPDGTRQPYEWLCEGLLEGAEAPGAPSDGLVWDLCCGSAPVADVVGADRYAGVDRSAPELAVGRAGGPGVRVELGNALTTDPPARPAALTIATALMLMPLEATALVQALQRHGFDLVSDEVAVVRRPVGPGDVDLVLRSFYLRGADGPRPGAAGDWLRARAAAPGFELDYPLRRSRAVRTTR